jgi:hypothetical protein
VYVHNQTNQKQQNMKRKLRSRYRLIALGVTIMMLISLVANAQRKVVGYIAKGSSSSVVDFAKITHLMLYFENADAAGYLTYNAGNDALITAAHNNGVKVLVSVGGGSVSNDPVYQSRYTNLMSASNRSAFISKIVSYLNAHNLDGIDLDLEGPAINENYNAFVPALKSALPAGKLLSAALSHTNNGDLVSSSAAQTFDFIGVMAYDRGWGQAVHHSTYDFAVTSANWWVTNRGVARSKIILGVPFYGYTNTTGSGSISFANIINNYGTAAAQQDTWISGGNTIYYNGVPTIRQKTQFVVDNGFGGIMIWQLAQDATGSLSLLYNIDQVIKSCTKPAQPGTIAGNTSVTAGTTNTYSIAAVSGATSYTWTLPSGWTGTSSTTSITATAGSAGGTISVKANNLCGSGTARTLTVTVSGTSANLALNKPTATSSVEAVGFEGSKAVDGNASTRWSSAVSDPQWLYVDLGSSYSVNRVRITWEAAYGKDYQVQISSNASTWTSIKTVTGNTSLTNDWAGLSGTGRYVRIYGTARGTAWGYSIFELQIYGTASGFTSKVEAENYKFMEGIITEPCSEGGLNVGSFDVNDYTSYAVNIPATTTYKVSFRVASIYSGKTLRFEKDAGTTLLGTVTVPNTGSWQVYQTVSMNANLPAGSYTVALATSTGGWNINWFEITSNLAVASGGGRGLADEASTREDVNVVLYPNPTSATLNIKTDAYRGGLLRIIDTTGKDHFSCPFDNDAVDVSALPPGLYVLKLLKGERSGTAKFIKQ